MEPKINKIAEDYRGAIFLIENLLENNKEFTFLEIKKGFARGGCIHNNKEFFAVIKGRVKFIWGDNEKILNQGDSGVIPPKMPHAFFALEDSIVSEWGITTKEKKRDVKDKELRAKVDEANKNMVQKN